MITLTITDETALELFSSAKGFLQLIPDSVPAKLPDKPLAGAAGTTSITAPTTSVSAPKQEAVTTPPPQLDSAVTEDADAGGTATTTYTLEEVRAKGLTAARQHGQKAVKAILDAMEVENMGGLKEGQFDLFVQKLEGLSNG